MDDADRVKRGLVVTVKNQMFLKRAVDSKRTQPAQFGMTIATDASHRRVDGKLAQRLVQTVKVTLRDLIVGVAKIPPGLPGEILLEERAFLEGQCHFLRFFFLSSSRMLCISFSE